MVSIHLFEISGNFGYLCIKLLDCVFQVININTLIDVCMFFVHLLELDGQILYFFLHCKNARTRAVKAEHKLANSKSRV